MLAVADPWVSWSWVGDHLDVIAASLREHLELTLVSVLLGFVLSVPVAVLAHRLRWLRPIAVAVSGVLYTVPSLAAFALLIPWTGLSRATAVIPLVAYTSVIFVRATLTGLDGVPADVLDAADGMGITARRRLLTVELPLALPTIMAGLRLATVTTVGLVTVTALLGYGGLGKLFNDAFTRDFRTPLTVGTVLCVVLAVALDLALAGVAWLLTPWARRGVRADR